MSLDLRKRQTIIPLLLAGLCICGAMGQRAFADSDARTKLFAQQTHWLLTGSDLSASQAGQLEQELKDKPDSLPIRIKLLGYYFFRNPSLAGSWLDPHAAADRIGFLTGFLTTRPHAGWAQRRRTGLVLWIIKHHPDTPIAGTPSAQHPVVDPQGYGQGKAAWLKQVQSHPKNTAVLSNASHFVELADPDKAVELLQKAKAIEPRHADFYEQLGHLYDRWSTDAAADQRKTLQADALKEYEAAMDLLTDPAERFYLMDDLAKTALGAGTRKKARKYAQSLLRMAGQFKDNWNYGNAIYTGHDVLGRLALREEDIQQAGRELLMAARTPGSPQLNSFGPDMTLAKALLKKGEDKVVREYLQAIGRFWVMPPRLLQEWKQAAK